VGDIWKGKPAMCFFTADTAGAMFLFSLKLA